VKSLELPLLALPKTHPCAGCGDCCRYVATQIERPTTNTDYDQIVWYLTHRDVSVYIDWEGDFYLEFRTLCDHLTPSGTCEIYRERPEICSEFSYEECEKGTGEPAHKWRFEKPAEFLAWFEQRRPKAFARFGAYREKLLRERDRKARARRAVQAHT
jgi:Fe-S-cluster containining protein